MVDLSILLAITGLAYIFIFKPRFEKKCKELIFNNRVLGFIDGLHLSGTKFGCADFEMRSYAQTLLEQAHSLPGNQILLEHTTAKGWRYSSHTALNGDHMTFALLCIIQHAKEHGNNELILLCEDMLVDARVSAAHYH